VPDIYWRVLADTLDGYVLGISDGVRQSKQTITIERATATCIVVGARLRQTWDPTALNQDRSEPIDNLHGWNKV
jgi:hypothetical protein